MNMKRLLLALALATAPALAHDKAEHAKKGQHQNAPRSFDKKPAAGTWARCPVSGDIFRVAPDTQFANFEGRVYAFCCEECAPDFAKDPAKYADKKSAP
jgi:YHS domain-containing protein